jgi:hypothetical protein
LLIDRFAVRAEGQKAHEGCCGGDITLRVATFAVHTLFEMGAVMTAASAVRRVAGHIEALVPTAFVARIAFPWRTVAGIIVLRSTHAVAAYLPGIASVAATAAIVRV